MKQIIFGICILVLLVVGFGVYRVMSRPTTLIGGAASTGKHVSFDAIDHSAFDDLLKKYVDGRGMVAYSTWKKNADDVQALDAYLTHLSSAERGLPAERSAELAFWINAYNAMTLKGILEVYPTTSIKNHASMKYDPRLKSNLWFDLYLQVGAEKFNLSEIEHEILRKMDEPRIHFALVCASKGCPPLRAEAYRADRLEEQLADNTRRFFARDDNFIADADSRKISVSDLLKWYDTDFGATPAEQMNRLRPYFPEPDSFGWLSTGPVKVDYLGYDWDLNEQ